MLELAGEGEAWTPVPDLLGSERFATDFVVEVESDGVAHLRFGDDERGREPLDGSTFSATYRVGNGRVGNVGAGAIARVVTASGGFVRVWNPLPPPAGRIPRTSRASGSMRPRRSGRRSGQSPRMTTRRSPSATEACSGQLRRSAGQEAGTRRSSRPTGSAAGRSTSPSSATCAGSSIGIAWPARTSSSTGRALFHSTSSSRCASSPGYFTSDVKHGLLEELGSIDLSDGRRGFFHPDNFTFGQRVYLSQIYAAAMEVAGINWVRATRFQRFGRAPNQELENEVLDTGRTEIARLDNDPSFPENGKLELVMRGGM